MTEIPFTDRERTKFIAMVARDLAAVRNPATGVEYEENGLLTTMLAKLTGTETVLVARRAYMPFGVTSSPETPQVKNAYFDPRFPTRECDNCGKSYNGPAVYCSLTCALADA